MTRKRIARRDVADRRHYRNGPIDIGNLVQASARRATSTASDKPRFQHPLEAMAFNGDDNQPLAQGISRSSTTRSTK